MWAVTLNTSKTKHWCSKYYIYTLHCMILYDITSWCHNIYIYIQSVPKGRCKIYIYIYILHHIILHWFDRSILTNPWASRPLILAPWEAIDLSPCLLFPARAWWKKRCLVSPMRAEHHPISPGVSKLLICALGDFSMVVLEMDQKHYGCRGSLRKDHRDSLLICYRFLSKIQDIGRPPCLILSSCWPHVLQAILTWFVMSMADGVQNGERMCNFLLVSLGVIWFGPFLVLSARSICVLWFFFCLLIWFWEMAANARKCTATHSTTPKVLYWKTSLLS